MLRSEFFLAYIDPVSGTIILQLIVGGIIGVVGFFRKSIWKTVSIFTRRSAEGRSAEGRSAEGRSAEIRSAEGSEQQESNE